MAYKDYLASPAWKRIRKAVLRRDGKRCRSCGAEATEVHHGQYDPATMRGADLSWLFSICHPCHEAATFSPTGQRRPASEVREMASRLEPSNRQKKANGRKRRGPMTIDRIRAESLEYAMGLRK